MERGNIFLIAVIVAALGFVGLRFFSDSSSLSPTHAGRAHAGRGGRLTADETGNEERVGHLGSAEREGRGGGVSGDRSARGRLARGGHEDGRGVSRSGRGSTQVVPGSELSRGGSVGTSASGRYGAGGPSGVSIVDSLREGGLGSKPGAADQGRNDLVETLASQPSTHGSLLEDRPPEVQNGEDVVLNVTSTEDTQDAQQNVDVNKPKYSEEGIELSPNSVLAFPDAGNVKGDAGTISVDFTNNWTGADENNNTLVQIRNENQWNDRFELVRNGKYLRFIITDSTGVERDISYNVDSWVAGERHQVTPTWGNGEMQLYVDGRLVGTNSYPGTLEIRTGTPMYLGSEFAGYKGFDGTIYKATVYGSKKTADDIGSNF
jgi:hypothetical protein